MPIIQQPETHAASPLRLSFVEFRLREPPDKADERQRTTTSVSKIYSLGFRVEMEIKERV